MSLCMLPAPPADFEGPKVFSLQANFWSTTIEPAGKSFETFLRVINGNQNLTHTATTEEPEANDEETEETKKYATHKKAPSLDTLIGTADYYELLGLGETRWMSTQDDIKKAYRKMCLLHHPDKQANASATVDEEVFKQIQKAFETLSNPKTKRAYDSRDAFDDSIPKAEEIKTDKDFYTIFGEVFERNTKWSTNPKMPKLGDENTPINETNRFYSVWYAFKSWREFSFLDEYDPETAETREEKRWMERKNEKERKRKENQEAARVYSLIDAAHKLDPRIRKMQEEERRIKEEIKQKRLDAIMKKKEEEEKIKREAQEKEEEEKRQAEAERKAQMEERNRVNNAKKKRRQKLRQAVRKVGASETDVEYLIDKLQEVEELNNLCSLLDAITDPSKENIEKFFTSEANQVRAKIEAEQKAQEEKLAAESKKKSVQGDNDKAIWTQEELTLLQRAVMKFPNGTRERWDRISEFIGGKKTEKQIIARVKAGISSYGSSSDESYQRWLKEKKEVKKETDTSGGTENYDKIATETSSPKPAPASGAASPKPTPASGTVSPKPAPASGAASPKPAPASGTASPKPTPASAASSPKPPAAASSESATSPEPEKKEDVEWSVQEQKLLEDALKKFPASLGKDRWAKVAEAVPGRSRRECVERYKQLVAAIQQQKGTK